MRKIALALILLLAAASSLAGCSSSGETNEAKNGRLKIYTTIFPLEDFTKKIGGDLVEVKSVYPPNTDAHSFEPSTKTMVKIAEGDAFIYTGAGIEGFADKAAETLKNEDVEIVKAAEGIELAKSAAHSHEGEAGHDEHEGHEHGDTDPHVWLDPIRSIQMAENIKNALVKKHPEGKETFEKNFAALKTNLEKLDKEYKDTLSKTDKKEILVSHAAYGYWQERYGIEQISVMGLSASDEPSQKQISAIIKDAKEHEIKHVIFEKNISSKLSEIVQKEIGATPLTVSNLESVTEEDAKNSEDYFSLMRKNLETLKTALTE
ncbi:zinc ABC transporter substrate-binding protein [Metabacillus sp. KIGAM252]|uniref:Zinc ABC transporter substrate-binding protein n=1 Tax=Metabacillus flavus TaxID=2823519 RepID=A0ABS5LHD2_9BACI|nr:metal ABC transporter substrate-binding protein [Metabacillus flavus]MBS2970171.1 zinc ABC transporter substrate-binding protein [Metabacillus flavus]